MGDAAPVASGRALAVSPAQPAAGGGTGAFVSTAATVGGGPQLVAGLGPARAVGRATPATPIDATPAAPQPVAEPEPPAPAPEPVATPIAAPAPEAAPQPVAALPKSPAGLGGAPSGPSAAGAGEFGEVEGEATELEEEEPVEEEAEEETTEEETTSEEEGECTPPFSLSYEGAEHEVALCFEAAGGETRLYLLLDGALIDVDVP